MIECRGRNGWFRFGAFRLLDLGNGSINLEILSSKAPWNVGPICFQGPKAEVLDLFAALQKHIAQEAYARFIIEAAPRLLTALKALLPLQDNENLAEAWAAEFEAAEEAITMAEKGKT
jgi:hypothetical protein